MALLLQTSFSFLRVGGASSGFLGARLEAPSPTRSLPCAAYAAPQASMIDVTRQQPEPRVKDCAHSGRSFCPKRFKQRVAAQTIAVTTGIKDGKLQKTEMTLGFTKDNELFVGRMAMIGVAASLIGELLTGKGSLAQLGLETGVPLAEIDGAILFLIAFNAIAAFAPTAGKFVPAVEEDFSDRQPGPLQDPRISILDVRRFFGITGFGFTKANELFVGRVAQLGFAGSLLGESLTGKGMLGQIGLATTGPLSYEADSLVLLTVVFMLFAAFNPGTGSFNYDSDSDDSNTLVQQVGGVAQEVPVAAQEEARQ